MTKRVSCSIDINNVTDVSRSARDDTAAVSGNRPTRRLLPKPTESESPSLPSTTSGFRGSKSSSNSPSLRGQSDGTASTYRSPELFASSSNTSDKSIVVSGASSSVLRRIADLHNRLPYPIPDPCKTLDGQWVVDAILTRLETVIDRWYFKPANHYIVHFRQLATERLRNSKFARLTSFVSMSVLESIITGDMSRSQLHNSWIEYIEGSLKHELSLDLTPCQMRNRQSALVSLMKTRLIPSINSYQLLRSITPAFLQVIYSDPVLWSDGCDLTRIPLSNILTSESHELAIFALIDCTYAMASGLPPQVEYDTTMYSHPSRASSHQWVHSSPIEFQLALADINACRDKSPSARDWKDIERWLLTWEPRPSEHPFVESWMTIAWCAVQESWRLVLLVYLYLAVCGATSDDPRIQSYVKQIMQVIGTVKKQGPPHVNVSFFSQYLIVGICARSEKHRQKARDGLSYATETKLWLMRAADFAPVLDHLWHGAAAGGRAIKWSDYVRSRETVLPVEL